MKGDVWCIPLGRDQALIYAPYHGITTLVNRSMSELVFRCLAEPGQPVPTGADWINVLRQPGKHPSRHCGPVSPLYLGLIPTRSCMMQCAYCDFVSAKNYQAMSYAMIRHVIDGYADILRGRFGAEWNMHFFGGEPFAAFGHVVFAVSHNGS